MITGAPRRTRTFNLRFTSASLFPVELRRHKWPEETILPRPGGKTNERLILARRFSEKFPSPTPLRARPSRGLLLAMSTMTVRSVAAPL